MRLSSIKEKPHAYLPTCTKNAQDGAMPPTGLVSWQFVHGYSSIFHADLFVTWLASRNATIRIDYWSLRQGFWTRQNIMRNSVFLDMTRPNRVVHRTKPEGKKKRPLGRLKRRCVDWIDDLAQDRYHWRGLLWTRGSIKCSEVLGTLRSW
jgi:hypothetical protein